jgi:cytochrome c-type biogenesis protein CcmH/NrfG
MQEPATSEQKRKRARLYFILAVSFLFVLALVWSLGAFLVYLLLGIIISFVVLGLLAWPWQRRTGAYEYRERSYQKSGPTHTSSKGFSKTTDSGKYTEPSESKKRMVVASIVFVFVFSIALVIVLNIVTSPDDTEAADQNWQTALKFYNEGQYDSAYIYYDRYRSQHADNVEVLFEMGNTAWNMHRLDSAVTMYDAVLQKNPANEDARMNKARIYFDQKNYRAAETELTSLLNQNASNLDAMQLLGDVYYDQEKYTEALNWYERAYSSGQRNNWICYVMGYLYEIKNDNTRAITLYKEALQYDSTVVDIYKRLGDLIPGKDGDLYRQRAEGRQW